MRGSSRRLRVQVRDALVILRVIRRLLVVEKFLLIKVLVHREVTIIEISAKAYIQLEGVLVGLRDAPHQNSLSEVQVSSIESELREN